MNYSYPYYERVYASPPYQGVVGPRGRGICKRVPSRTQVVFASVPGPSQAIPWNTERQIDRLTQQVSKLTTSVNRLPKKQQPPPKKKRAKPKPRNSSQSQFQPRKTVQPRKSKSARLNIALVKSGWSLREQWRI